MAEHNEIGKIGENIAERYLISKGYNIIERNFHVKGGEIDIICNKNIGNLHMKQKNISFVEVKTKKVSDFTQIAKDIVFSPENNLTKTKRQRIHKAIKHYLSFKKLKENELDINIVAMIIFINPQTKEAKIRMYEDFIL